MLGVIPVRRFKTINVIASTLYNLVITAPWVAAFWVLTKWYRRENDGECTGIPWDVAIFARWAFLGIAAYQLFALPFNIYQANRTDWLKTRDSRIHHWLKMADALHWLANWALFFYLVVALVHRESCEYTPLVNLFWCVVFISAGFGAILFSLLFIGFLTDLVGLIKDVKAEAKVVDDVETKAASQQELQNRMKQGGAVEIMEVRRAGQSGMEPNRDRGLINVQSYERGGRDIEGRGERILDKVSQVAGGEGFGIDKKPEGARRGEREEAINLDDNPRMRREEPGRERHADIRDVRDSSPTRQTRPQKY